MTSMIKTNLFFDFTDQFMASAAVAVVVVGRTRTTLRTTLRTTTSVTCWTI